MHDKSPNYITLMYISKKQWAVFVAIITPVLILSWRYNHQIFLAINGVGSSFLGLPMLFLSAMADGMYVIMISALAYRKKKGYYWPFLVSYLLAALIVQIIKRNNELGRPLTFYPEDTVFHEGEILLRQSFPSGHSAAAMVLARYLAEGLRSRKNIFAVLLLGVSMAFSRVYIAAHFPIDVVVGALIGFLTSHFIFQYAEKKSKHASRPEYRYNSLLISILGLSASVFFVILQEDFYPPITLFLNILAGILGLYFTYIIIQEFFKIYRTKRFG